jgi:hypothetical protein
MKELARRFFSLRNVVPLLIIVGAFIGTFIPTPFGLQREQLLLALLAFLAVDALIERLELLTNIEQDVSMIKGTIASQTAGTDYLRTRSEFPRLEHIITEARKEIWVSGVALDKMATIAGIFDAKLAEGFTLRFLAISPEESVVKETAAYFGVDAAEFAGRLETSLRSLYRRLAQRYPQQVEIRTLDHRLAHGYFIVDPHLEQGFMTIMPYLHVSADATPMLRLFRRTDSRWFGIYLREFETLWNRATRWDIRLSDVVDGTAQ